MDLFPPNLSLQLLTILAPLWNAEDTWDLQVKSGLTDEQLDKVRKIAGDKVVGLENIFACSKGAGEVRRKEQHSLFERLKRQKSPSGGTYFSIKESMRLLIELYGDENSYEGDKIWRWKVSMDGRKIAGKDQVMMGITPMDFGLAV